jgi:hypothetical protein
LLDKSHGKMLSIANNITHTSNGLVLGTPPVQAQNLAVRDVPVLEKLAELVLKNLREIL